MPLGPVIVPDVFGDVPVVGIGKIQKQLQTSLLQQRGEHLYAHGVAVGVAGGADLDGMTFERKTAGYDSGPKVSFLSDVVQVALRSGVSVGLEQPESQSSEVEPVRILCQPIGYSGLCFIREVHRHAASADFDGDTLVVLPPGRFVLRKTVPAPVRERIERHESLESGDIHAECEASVADLCGTVRVGRVGHDTVSRHDRFPVDA